MIATTARVPDLLTIPLTQLHESPMNPRRTFEVPALQQLAESLLSHGQLTPVIVRPHPTVKGGYELAAGHRRYRAAAMAKLPTLDAIVRPLDDTALLEVLTIENLQREDVHPLEEAEGFAALLKQATGYDVARIATRIGKSERYVYDRLTLLQLIEPLRWAFREGHLQLSHAILAARQTTALQATFCKDVREYQWKDTLFTSNQIEADDLFDMDHDDEGEDALATWKLGLKTGRIVARPVREFELWLRENVRLSLDDAHTAVLFPTTVEQVAEAAEAELSVVHITMDFTLPRGVASTKKDPVLTSFDYKPAEKTPDGEPGKPCKEQQLGVVVVGPHQGAAFRVCTARTTCKVHWAKEIAQAAAAEKARVTAKAAGKPAPAPKKDAWQIRQEKEQAERKQLKPHLKTLQEVFRTHIAKAPLTPTSPLMQGILRRTHGIAAAMKAIGGPVTPELVLRADVLVGTRIDEWRCTREQLLRMAKEVGLDLAPTLKPLLAPPKVEQKAAPAKAKQKVATKTVVKAAKVVKATAARVAREPKAAANARFMACFTPSPALAAIVGTAAQPKTAIVKKLWEYIKREQLQDQKNKRMINLDAKMKAVLGEGLQIYMFAMSKALEKHLTLVTPEGKVPVKQKGAA